MRASFCISVLCLAASSAHALIATNENAIGILGQFTSTTNDTTPNYTQSAMNNNAAWSGLGF